MQTILGANGQIAEELTKELYRNYTNGYSKISFDGNRNKLPIRMMIDITCINSRMDSES